MRYDSIFCVTCNKTTVLSMFASALVASLRCATEVSEGWATRHGEVMVKWSTATTAGTAEDCHLRDGGNFMSQLI